MRSIEIDEYLKITGLKRGTYDARQTLREVAFAFGLQRRPAGGVLFDLDCLYHFFVEALTPICSRKHAASIITIHSDEAIGAVGLADAKPKGNAKREDVYLAAVEFGPGYAQIRGRRNDKMMKFAAMTLAKLSESAAKHPDQARGNTRITLVNVTTVLREVRVRAARIGLDFSAPFFPPDTDEMAAKLIATAKKDRERFLRMVAEAQLAAGEARQ